MMNHYTNLFLPANIQVVVETNDDDKAYPVMLKFRDPSGGYLNIFMDNEPLETTMKAIGKWFKAEETSRPGNVAPLMEEFGLTYEPADGVKCGNPDCEDGKLS